MYRVYKNGLFIGLSAKPVYVEKLYNGAYGLCDAAQATAIVYAGAVYPLEEVVLVPVDAGTVLTGQAEQLSEQLAMADEAAIELYESNLALQEVSTAQDDALIELYEMAGGGL